LPPAAAPSGGSYWHTQWFSNRSRNNKFKLPDESFSRSKIFPVNPDREGGAAQPKQPYGTKRRERLRLTNLTAMSATGVSEEPSATKLENKLNDHRVRVTPGEKLAEHGDRSRREPRPLYLLTGLANCQAEPIEIVLAATSLRRSAALPSAEQTSTRAVSPTACAGYATLSKSSVIR
jgi:hypothetical protein